MGLFHECWKFVFGKLLFSKCSHFQGKQDIDFKPTSNGHKFPFTSFKLLFNSYSLSTFSFWPRQAYFLCVLRETRFDQKSWISIFFVKIDFIPCKTPFFSSFLQICSTKICYVLLEWKPFLIIYMYKLWKIWEIWRFGWKNLAETRFQIVKTA